MDMHSQKYNPEVPTELGAPSDNGLHKINDQLITMRNIVNKQVRFFIDWAHFSECLLISSLYQPQMTHLSRSDNDKMFSDMAENSGDGYTSHESDDEDYDDAAESGSGTHCKN